LYFFISEGTKVDDRRPVGSVRRPRKKRLRWEASDGRPHESISVVNNG
jgi:hypothetical protein